MASSFDPYCGVPGLPPGYSDPYRRGSDPMVSMERYFKDEMRKMQEFYERELMRAHSRMPSPPMMPPVAPPTPAPHVMGIDPGTEVKKVDSAKHKDIEVFDDPLSVPKDWKPWEPQWESTKPSKGICSEAAYFGWGKACR